LNATQTEMRNENKQCLRVNSPTALITKATK